MSKNNPTEQFSQGWEDNAGEVVAKDDSDMEGWEEDGWGTFNSTSSTHDPSHDPLPNMKSSQQSWETLSSGADFFDNFSTTNKPSSSLQVTEKTGEFSWSTFGPQAAEKAKSPPLISSSLFGDTGNTSANIPGTNTGSKTGSNFRNVTDVNVENNGNGEWADWDEDFEMTPVVEVCTNP